MSGENIEVRAVPIREVIGSDDIAAVASRGFPLRESVDALLLRNQRITLAYHSLATQLTDLLATGGHERVANWCTFATWSSKTIGMAISPTDEPVGLIGRRLPFRRTVVRALKAVSRRDRGVMFRSLAAGNRFIFLEVGTGAALFVEHFGPLVAQAASDPSPLASVEREARWQAYWSHFARSLDELKQLDPSWLPSQPGDPELLSVGMRLYFEALWEPDPDRRSELILAANLQVGAYEQWRAEGYIATSFSLRGRAAFRRLMIGRTGRSPRRLGRLTTALVARLYTRLSLALALPNEVVRVGRPLLAPIDERGERAPALFSKHLTQIDEPRLQALLSRYDLDDFNDAHKRGARSWLDYHERMHFIANLFRSRHDDRSLIETPPFGDARHVSALRNGHLYDANG